MQLSVSRINKNGHIGGGHTLLLAVPRKQGMRVSDVLEWGFKMQELPGYLKLPSFTVCFQKSFLARLGLGSSAVPAIARKDVDRLGSDKQKQHVTEFKEED